MKKIFWNIYIVLLSLGILVNTAEKLFSNSPESSSSLFMTIWKLFIFLLILLALIQHQYRIPQLNFTRKFWRITAIVVFGDFLIYFGGEFVWRLMLNMKQEQGVILEVVMALTVVLYAWIGLMLLLFFLPPIIAFAELGEFYSVRDFVNKLLQRISRDPYKQRDKKETIKLHNQKSHTSEKKKGEHWLDRLTNTWAYAFIFYKSRFTHFLAAFILIGAIHECLDLMVQHSRTWIIEVFGTTDLGMHSAYVAFPVSVLALILGMYFNLMDTAICQIFIILLMLGGLRNREIGLVTGVRHAWRRIGNPFVAETLASLRIIPLLFLIVPGILSLLRYLYVPVIGTLHKSLTPKQILDESSRLTSPDLGALFVLFFATSLMCMAANMAVGSILAPIIGTGQSPMSHLVRSVLFEKVIYGFFSIVVCTQYFKTIGRLS